MLYRLKDIQRILADSSGFTLVEVVVSVSLMTVVVGLVGSAIFQVTSIQRFWADDVAATRDLRQAASRFSGDALNAEDALDSGGVERLTCQPDPPEDTITLTWTDTTDLPRSAKYSVADGILTRETQAGIVLQVIDGGVVDGSVSFSLCGNLLTMEAELEAERENTETISLRTYLRKLR